MDRKLYVIDLETVDIDRCKQCTSIHFKDLINVLEKKFFTVSLTIGIEMESLNDSVEFFKEYIGFLSQKWIRKKCESSSRVVQTIFT